MRTKTGLLGVCLMGMGALVASSANTKTAAARSNAVEPLASVQVIAKATAVDVVPVNVSTAPQAPAPAAGPVEVITPPPADPYLENPKLRRMRTGEISKGMLAVAASIVHRHYAKPVGTLIEVEVDGRPVIARIERHFHPEGGPLKPWGFHPGVSLFAHR